MYLCIDDLKSVCYTVHVAAAHKYTHNIHDAGTNCKHPKKALVEMRSGSVEWKRGEER